MSEHPVQQKSGTLTAQITHDLQCQIESGALRAGTRLASASELCARYGVSNITARAVVRELARLGYAESRGRAGVFVKKRDSAAVAPAREKTIGLVLHHLNHPFYTDMLAAVEAACRAENYGLKVVGSAPDTAAEIKLLAQLASEVAGLLIIPQPRAQVPVEYAAIFEQEIPIVLLTRYLDGLDLPVVVTDNELGGYLMGQHLLKAGCDRICILQDYVDTAARDRIEGCRRAMREFDKPNDLLLKQSAGFGETAGYVMTREWLQEASLHGRDRWAIFALNQQLAQGASIALREAGRRVPTDVALAGFDDTYAVFFDPPLTTIRQDLAGIGSQAVALLARQIEGAVLLPGRRLHQLEPELIIRNSTDPHSDFSVSNYLLDTSFATVATINAATGNGFTTV